MAATQNAHTYTPRRLSWVQDVAIVTITNLRVKERLSFSAKKIEEVAIATVLRDYQNWAWQDAEIKKKPHLPILNPHAYNNEKGNTKPEL